MNQPATPKSPPRRAPREPKPLLPTDPALKNRRYIVVEGPVGVGKTSLARNIAASLGAGLVMEQPDKNPFLERFYRAPSQYALQTQLFFLFQRVQQLKQLRHGDLFAPVRVADFMLAKDPIFARLTLDPDELYLYENVYQNLVTTLPTPDLVIYLQAPTEVLLARIHKRGVLFERKIEHRYLDALAEAYARYFLDYRESALLMVNAEKLNFVDDPAHFELLLNQALRIESGRHYFNPLLE